MRHIELLSPARDLACGIEAIRHGADAVYIGAPRFGARAAAGNSVADIASLVAYAHPYGVRIYVTLNTLLRDDELTAVQLLVDELAAAGVDALITQDKRIVPASATVPRGMACVRSGIALHSSTQMDNRTPADVQARLRAGYEQTVLARELAVADIRAIHSAVPQMPLEVFVHGALCVSLSGRCYASQYCFGRSANRGECAQFCRLPFTLTDAQGHTLTDPRTGLPLHQRHLLSLKDMNRSAHLEELMDAGVSSFKIEGRLKDAAYVKNTTAYYRRRIDQIIARRPADYARASCGVSTISFHPDVAKSFNRGFTDYYLHGRTPQTVFQPLTPKAIGEGVGRVEAVRHYAVAVSSQAVFHAGDGLCYFDREGHLQGFRVNSIDAAGRLHPATMPDGLTAGTPLFRNVDAAFEAALARPTAERRVPASWHLTDADGFTLTLRASTGHTATMRFDYPHETARTPQDGALRRQLLRLGDTIFACTEADITIAMSREWFIPASVLGEWRRQVCAQLTATMAAALPQRPQTAVTEADVTPDDADGRTWPLMTCRHCLRYAYGQCPRHQTPDPAAARQWGGTLHLALADGRTFPLHFDCQRCLMTVERPR